MSTATDLLTERLVEALYRIEGKAEIVNGHIEIMSPTGDLPSTAAFAIASSLRDYARAHGGRAYGDNAGFLVDLPNRKSFCPDAAYYTGPRAGMKFLPQAPDFAVEVRSEGDYGPSAEREMEKKRGEYFAAGAAVVWDVDLDSQDVVRVYRASSPDTPTIYRRGEVAEAEPAVPGWTMPVNELFE
ncbi:MAG: Uma2 family endonuclease [Planctomycetota bacterium]|nr:MAG: Uma2 family endonuclease [Planctomycetota bacterium]